jgi:predicted nuclease of predicted toxin-antitoxin system
MARLLGDSLFQRNSLSPDWIPLLQAAGHEAVHWSEVGDPRTPDTVLMQWAIANCYAIFTHDLDFGTMLDLSGAAGPSVLQARCLNVLHEAIVTLVLSLLKSYGAEIEQVSLVGADQRRQRVRILPLKRTSRADQTKATVQVQVYASGSVHGCPPPSAGGPGRAA